MKARSDEKNSSYDDSSFHFDDNSTHRSPTFSFSPRNQVQNQRDLVSENANLRAQVKDLTARLEMMKSKFDRDQKDIKDELLTAKNNETSARNELVKTVKSFEEKLIQQSTKNKELSKINQELKQQIDAFLNQVNYGGQKKIQTLKEASDIFNNLYSSSEYASDKIKHLESENSSLLDQLDESSQLLKRGAKENLKLKRKLKQKRKIDNQDDQDSLLKEVAHKMKRSHQNELKEAQSIIDEQKDEILKLKEQLDRSLKTNIQITKDSDSISNNINKILAANTGSNNDIYEANIAILESKLKTTEQLVNDKNDAIHTLQETVDELKEKVNDLSDQLQEAQVTVVAHNESIKVLHEKLKQAKEIIQELNSEITTKDTEIQKYDTTLHELRLKVNQLEAEKQKALLNISKTTPEPAKKYKDKIELYNSRLNSLEELINSQATEIIELHDQRKQLISNLLKVDGFLTEYNENVQEILKYSNDAKNETKELQKEIENQQKREKLAFNKAFNDCIEMIPRELVKECQEYRNHEPSNVLRNFVETLVFQINKLSNAEPKEANNNSAELNELKNRYRILLTHLQNAVKLIKSFANSQFPPIIQNTKSEEYVELTRDDLLISCARISKFIQEQNIQLPVPDFSPSLFEPAELNDPEKTAKLFLDFVSNEKLEKSPFKELFTIFMSVVQVNHILIKNIESNKFVLQQAARANQLEDSYQQTIRELELWKDHQGELNKLLTPLLNSLADDDNNNIEELDFPSLVKYIVDNIKPEELATPKKTKALLSQITALKKQVDQVQKEIENYHKAQANNKQKFYEKADKIIVDLQKQIEKQTKSYENEKAILSAQLKETKRLLDDAKISYDSTLKKVRNKLQKKDDLINSLRNENESLTQRSVSFQNQISQQQSQADDDNEAMSSLKAQLRTTAEKLQKMTEHKQHYKQKLIEAEAAKSTILDDLKRRSDELSMKYSSTIAQMDEELSSAREALSNAQNEIETLEQKKQELSLQNAKLRLSERAANLKLNAANEALIRERSVYEARQNSMNLALKAKTDATLAAGAEFENEMIKLLNKILQDEYGIASENESDLKLLILEINDALENRKYEQFAILDAMKLRRLLRLSPQESLFDKFKNYEREAETQKQLTENAKAEAHKAKNATDHIMREYQKIEKSSIELNEWISWGRTMIRYVSDTANINSTTNQIRFILEEALLSSIKQKDIRRKIEILRSEKKLLLSNKPVLIRSPVKETILSIRPIILSLIFSKQLQILSCHVPIKYNS